MNIWERIKNEPALLTALVAAFLSLLISFGVQVNTDQYDAILNFVNAILMVVVGGIVRSQVTPTRKLKGPQ